MIAKYYCGVQHIVSLYHKKSVPEYDDLLVVNDLLYRVRSFIHTMTKEKDECIVKVVMEVKK